MPSDVTNIIECLIFLMKNAHRFRSQLTAVALVGDIFDYSHVNGRCAFRPKGFLSQLDQTRSE